MKIMNVMKGTRIPAASKKKPDDAKDETLMDEVNLHKGWGISDSKQRAVDGTLRDIMAPTNYIANRSMFHSLLWASYRPINIYSVLLLLLN